MMLKWQKKINELNKLDQYLCLISSDVCKFIRYTGSVVSGIGDGGRDGGHGDLKIFN